MKRFQILLSLLILTISLGNLSSIRAQEETISASEPASSDTSTDVMVNGQIWKRERLQSEINTVRSTYRGQIETYRTLENNYVIAKDQYQSLQTLTSIEDAVRATKEVLLSRDDVLSTYLTLLKLKLIDQNGIEVTQKKQALETTEALIIRVAEHRATVESSQNREEMNARSDEFLELGKEIEAAAYRNLVLLSVGKLQTAYDKSLSIEKELQQLVKQEGNTPDLAKKQRALREIHNLLTATQQDLQDYWTDIQKKEGSSSKSLYTQLVQDLNPIYVQLMKVHAYFEEVLTLE